MGSELTVGGVGAPAVVGVVDAQAPDRAVSGVGRRLLERIRMGDDERLELQVLVAHEVRSGKIQIRSEGMSVSGSDALLVESLRRPAGVNHTDARLGEEVTFQTRHGKVLWSNHIGPAGANL